MPVPPQCAKWSPARCHETSAHWLVHPDGGENPGGHYCHAHALEICAEIREKCNERWTLAPIVKQTTSAAAERSAR